MSGNQWSWLVVIDVTTKQGSLYPCDTGIAYAFNQVYLNCIWFNYLVYLPVLTQQSPTRSQVCPNNPGFPQPILPFQMWDVGSTNPYGSGFFVHGTFLVDGITSQYRWWKINTTWDAPRGPDTGIKPTFFGHPNILSLCRMFTPSTGSVACAGVLFIKIPYQP